MAVCCSEPLHCWPARAMSPVWQTLPCEPSIEWADRDYHSEPDGSERCQCHATPWRPRRPTTASVEPAPDPQSTKRLADARKTYVGRPEADEIRGCAMTTLGNGLYDANHMEDASSVKEAELSMLRRVGASEERMLIVQSNLANSYQGLGRHEEALRLRRDVYFGLLRLNGELDPDTLREANNFADSLCDLDHRDEAKMLLRKTIPLARRVLGEGNEITLRMRRNYARTLSSGGDTLDDLSEAVDTLEDLEQIARRVLGDAHPFTESLGILPQVRDALTTKRRNLFLEGCGFGPG